MYHFKEEINYQVFFWFDKNLIKNMNWALLPKPSKAIFPVIACHCNKKGRAFPSERTLAILAGRTDKRVREGTQGLIGFPGFRISYYVTKRGKRAKSFHVSLPSPDKKGRVFPFHRCIIDGGNWAKLKPSARALYPVMRYFGFINMDILELEEGLDVDPMDFDEFYRDRQFEYCEADLDIMAEHAGITKRSMPEALKDLQERFLIEPIRKGGFTGWKVFLIPPRYYKRDYLNKKTMQSYARET